MSSLNLEDVFKLSGVPDLTFVEPEQYGVLFIALRTKGRGVVVEGPSGIGKTSCVVNALKNLNMDTTTRVLSGRKPSDLADIQKLLTEEEFGTVVIDDFHKLPDNLKRDFSNLLKTLADEEVTHSKLILVGINKTGYSLVEYARDLRNRIDIIKFQANPNEKMMEVIGKGEEHLNIDIEIKNQIVNESCGSFHIVQMLAHRACLLSKIYAREDEKQKTTVSVNKVRESVLTDLGLSFEDLTTHFSKGQRQKSGTRAPYLHVLLWLSQSDEMSININSTLTSKPLHKNSVSQIITKGHLKAHFNKHNEYYSEVLYYNDETTDISVEDPKYFYYIKNVSWPRIADKIGFHLKEDSELVFQYDFALSFAGSNRDLARAISEQLINNNVAVFYDNDEQASILSENVEDYLTSIYVKDARYVVAILGPDYPNRVWCHIEAKSFKHRFGENSIIPLWFVGHSPTPLDSTSGVGGFTYDPAKAMDPQVAEFTGLLVKKMEEIQAKEKATAKAGSAKSPAS